MTSSRSLLRLSRRWGGVVLGMVLYTACSDTSPTAVPPSAAAPTTPATTAPTPVPAAADAPRFAWLAPLGDEVANPGTFDAAAAPVVEICVWSGAACAGAPVARYTTAPSGSELPLAVNSAAGLYEASWNLMSSTLTTRRTYRIRVLKGGAEAGAVSVDAVRGRWGLTRTDGTLAPLTASSALPIRFALAVIPGGLDGLPSVTRAIRPEGGVVELPGITSVSFPGGALPTPTEVRLAVTRDPTVQTLYTGTTLLAGPRSDREVRIHTGEVTPLRSLTIRFTVPAAFLAILPANAQVQLFAMLLEAGGDEIRNGFEPIDGSFDPVTRIVQAELPQSYFSREPGPESNHEAIVVLGSIVPPEAVSPAAALGSRVSLGADRRGALVARACDIELAPALENSFVTSPFGEREIRGKMEVHKGMDLRADHDVLYAPADGRIINVGFENPDNPSQGFGYRVIIEHRAPNGAVVWSTFGHLDEGSVEDLDLKVGSRVTRGKPIGETDNTGSSTGPHLHQALTVQRKTVDANGKVVTSWPRIDPATCITLPPPKPEQPPESTVARVAVTPASLKLKMAETESGSFSAVALDADDKEVGGQTFTWSSSDEGVAKVSSTGAVTAIGEGNATVTVRASGGGPPGTAGVSVERAAVDKVVVSPEAVTLSSGGAKQLAVVVKDAKQRVLSGREVKWSSSNSDVADVSQSGLVTAGKISGKAEITATSEGKHGTSSITVIGPQLWPMAVGNRWTQDGTALPDVTFKRDEVVLSQQGTGDDATFVVRRTRRTPGINNVVTDLTVANRPDGLYLGGVLSYAYPAAVGTKAPSGFEVLALDRRETVAAGSFTCVMYRRESAAVREDECWAPGVGMVIRRQYTFRNGSFALSGIIELTSKSLQP